MVRTLKSSCPKGQGKRVNSQAILADNMKNLIVNADDLGWTAGVNRGIAEAHRNGLVTSASLLANGAAFVDAIQLSRQTPNLGIGVHLNLSDGLPLAQPAKIQSLLDKTGGLHGGPGNLLLRLAAGRLVL